MISLSATQARRLALSAQGLSRAPACSPWPRRDLSHLRQTMASLQLLQLDSVPIVARSHLLPLYARLGPYDIGLLDRIAYQRDEWFETWAHEASLAPVELEPWLRFMKRRAAQGHTWRNLWRLANEDPAYIERVHDEVAARGPLGASELTDARPASGGDWWGTRSQGALALDWLFRIGRLGVRRRGNFEKVFDLPERILPAEILAAPTPDESDSVRELLRRSARALGVASANDLIDYFRLPPTLARPRLAELVEAGDLLPCEVRGWKCPAYLAVGAKPPSRARACTLLSPFDPIVWNRDRASRLFGFDYRIEIYTPADKRRYGYYVLPFLLGDRLVARLDLKMIAPPGACRYWPVISNPATMRTKSPRHWRVNCGGLPISWRPAPWRSCVAAPWRCLYGRPAPTEPTPV
ncbi:MAG: crosslink repair DNA glycosylase YcaQ family protein [Burkholderiaceae bacterium]